MWYSWIFALGEWHICIANFSGFLNFYNKYLQVIGMCYSNNCDVVWNTKLLTQNKMKDGPHQE